MNNLSALFTRAKSFIFTPQELAEQSEYPFLPKLLRKRQPNHFPPCPHQQGKPHIIVHFPLETSNVRPAPIERDPHASNQVLLQVKDFQGRYSAALFEEIEIKGKIHYMLCDITFNQYLHNRHPRYKITQSDVRRFFRKFGDTVLKSVEIKPLRIPALNNI